MTKPDRHLRTVAADEQPALPYTTAGIPNSGWAGTDTSQERARQADRKVTGDRQMHTLWLLRNSSEGMTWRELSSQTGWHHGQASGVLTGLHKMSKIARLAETRNRCHVYVMPDRVDGREVGEAGHTSTNALLAQMADLIARLDPGCTHRPFPESDCVSCQAADVLRHYEGRSKKGT